MNLYGMVLTDLSLHNQYAYLGSRLVVPLFETWEIVFVFIVNGSGYSVQIDKKLLKKLYKGGEEIQFPNHIEELHLFDKSDLVQIKFFYSKV